VCVTQAGWTPLHIASEKGHGKAAKALLSHKADLARTIEGTDWTPLFLASDRAHEATVALLLKAGGDAKAKLGKFKLTEFAGRFASDTQQDRIRVLIDPTYQPPERDEKKARGSL
jgi:ankyrin repeat protein